MNDPTTDTPGLRPGRSCRHCIKIKTKCVPLIDSQGSICERCKRLGKLCSTPRAVQRKLARTVRSDAGETTPSQPIISRADSHQSALPTPISEQPDNLDHEGSNNASIPDEATLAIGHTQGFTHQAIKLIEISPEIGHIYGTTFHETLFDSFRNRIIRFFPFVNMSQMTSPAQVSGKQPFFYSCCVLIAAHRDPPLQSRLGRDLLRFIGEHMLLRGEKSMDMLQGLLLLTAWFSSYSLNQPQLMNVYHLAKALLVDLGLNSEAGKGMFQIKMANEAAHIIHGGCELRSLDQPGGLQGRRVCLGIFHAHTQYYHAFHRLDPPVWSTHIQSCFQALEKHQQDYQDSYALGLLRLDQLLDRYAGPQAVQPGLAMPISTYLRLFTNDMNGLRANLSESLRQDRNFDLHVYHTQLFLNEQAAFADSGEAIQKVEALHLCLNTVISFIDSLCTQDNSDVPETPFINWIMLAHSFDTLARLLFYNAAGWDLDYVRNSPGFCALSDRMIEKLDSIRVSEELVHGTEKSAKFKLFADRIVKFKQWYNDKVQAEQRTSNSINASMGNNDDAAFDPSFELPLFNDFSHLLWQEFNMSYPRLDNDLTFL